ncbi:PorP/SprF family type IX secretion system membrane protein [Hymenobacter psychrotolerans]|uniref:Type IX secretion system membrane protein, PorP/SprF family n=1 Tax=Hymenobacter psychrotolerans DSM 18569 TaxID=1121959 RepID=A0A1M6PAN4_9BACT|nr:PorP/SprF family type IX secretion system membrane protein [Hymenobacter psychrotolerans]SHK04932.1 type IX secretion system membrane protein, PorP/SprF family [Hymenobacter psychrotolerans DSM 18569]
MKGTLLSTLLLTTVAGTALAQQQPQFTHYGFNGMYLNPAYAGIKGQGEITAIGRYQYFNYKASFDDGGEPKTYMITGSLPVRVLGGGIGFHLYRDEIAQFEMTNAQISYSKHFELGEGKLGIGVQGIYNYLSKGVYRAIDPDDATVPRDGSDSKIDAGVGVWYESPTFYAGLSMNNLLRSEYNFTSESTSSSNMAKYIGENHSYFTAGYNIEASSSVVVTPSVLVKMVMPGKFGDDGKFTFKNNSYEANVRATFNDKFWGGLGYRYDESFTGMAGLALAKDNALRLGYAFDFVAFNQDARALSSHEIMLSYRLPKPGMATKPAIRTPRYSF